jgi:acyl-homoserine-lactone acylase
MNALLVSGRGPVTPRGPDGRWTPDDVQAALLGNHSLLASLLVDEVVDRVKGAGEVQVDGRPADVGATAAILAGWDGCYDLDAVGAVLWREFVASFAEAERADGGSLFAEGFDPDDPVATPCGLTPAPAGGADPVVDAMARALHALEDAGLAPDVSLAACQFADRGGQRFAIHGGYEVEGIANVIASVGSLARADLEPGPDMPPAVPGRTERTGLHVGGYPAIYGVSFVMVVAFTDEGPDARGLLVYGQSGDPESPHHTDQLDDFGAKRLRPLRFTDAEIAADPVQERRTLIG